jgi:uncharacterized protein
LALVIEGGLVLLAVGLGWLLDHPPLKPSRFRLDGWGFLAGVAAAVPMLVAFLVMLRWPVGPLRGIKVFTESVIRPLLAPCTLIDLLGISVLAGVGEEMLFRGLLQDVFVGLFQGALEDVLPASGDPVPLCLGVALASLLFGLMHAVTPAYAVLAGLMGVYLGGVYLWSGNLLAPMIAHGQYDFVVLLYLMYGPGSSEVAEVEEKKEQEEPAP